MTIINYNYPEINKYAKLNIYKYKSSSNYEQNANDGGFNIQ